MAPLTSVAGEDRGILHAPRTRVPINFPQSLLEGSDEIEELCGGELAVMIAGADLAGDTSLGETFRPCKARW